MSPNAFRTSIVAAVVAISLLGVVAFATVLAGELTDRSVLVLGVILGFLGPTIVSLLGLLKVDRMHEDVLNGPMRDNVKRAISEDRHALKNREAGVQARAQIRAIKRARGEQPDSPDDAS